MKLIFLFFLAAFVAANLIVKHFGQYGLWFSSALLIPFDFVARCVIHEKYKGYKLVLVLFALTLCAAAVTVAFNWNALNIAAASICGFAAAQLGAGAFYQGNIKRSLFIKVNISDLIAICLDSVIFQIVAFSSFNPTVTLGQIVIKFLGGLFWYFVLFRKREKIYKWPSATYKPKTPKLDPHEQW